MSRTTALLLALAVAIAAPAAARAHVQDAGDVVVLRGLDRKAPGAHEDAFGVQVIRGQAAATRGGHGRTTGVSEPAMPERGPVAGKLLWLLNEAGDQVTACRLRKTHKVRRHAIDCFSEALPR
jgi:hypothetical protein